MDALLVAILIFGIVGWSAALLFALLAGYWFVNWRRLFGQMAQIHGLMGGMTQIMEQAAEEQLKNIDMEGKPVQ